MKLSSEQTEKYIAIVQSIKIGIAMIAMKADIDTKLLLIATTEALVSTMRASLELKLVDTDMLSDLHKSLTTAMRGLLDTDAQLGEVLYSATEAAN